MKNVRIMSEELRKYLEKYEIGYPFDETDRMAREDCDDYDEDDRYADDIGEAGLI